MSQLWKFAYISDITAPLKSSVDEIVEVSSRNNRAAGLSGVLFHDKRSFLQVLEGGKDSLATTMLTICADPRHSNVRVLTAAPSMTRMFSSWGMGRASLPDQRRTLARFARDVLDKSDAERALALDSLCLSATLESAGQDAE